MRTLSFRMLLRKSGTVESILAIALIVAILASITSVVNHINSQAKSMGKLLNVGETFLIISKNSTSITDSKVDAELVSLIRNNIDTRYVLPQKIFEAGLVTTSNRSTVLVRGVDTRAFLEARNAQVNGVPANDTQANVGEILARLVSINEGDEVNIAVDSQTVTVEVAGIVKTFTQSDTELIVPMSIANELTEDNVEVSFIEFAIEDGEQAEIDNLSGRLPANVKIVETQQTQAFIQDVNNQTISFLNLWSIAVYAIVAAASYIVAARLTIESCYELTMLKALGANPTLPFKLILSFTIVTALLGSVLGLAVGLSGAQIISSVTKWIWKNIQVAPTLEIQQTAQIILLTLASSILGSVYPAFKAMRKTYTELPL